MDEQVRRISRNDSRRGFRESETVALTSSGCRSADDPFPASSQIWRRTSS